MSGTVRRRPDFSDIDNLDRATEAFLRDQRRMLMESKFVKAPRTAPRWIEDHWKQALATAALVLVGGIAVFAGVKNSSNGRDLRAAEPETTISEEVPVTSEQQTEIEKTEAASSAEEKVSDTESENTPAVTTTVRTTEESVAEELPLPRTSADSSTTRRTETTSSSSSSAETSKSSSSKQQEKVVTTTASQRGSSGVKAVTNSTTRTTAATTKTTTATTRSTTRSTTTTTRTTTAKPVTTVKTTTTTTQTTTKVTEAPKAVLSVQSVKVSDMKKVTNGYQQRVTVTISNVSTVRFSELRTFYLQISSQASKAVCASGGATLSKTTGTSLPFGYSGPISGGGTATISFLIISERPVMSASCTF